MSAAATAAGYLYASGRLRGKSKDGEHGETHGEGRGPREAKRHDGHRPDERGAPRRRPLRVAVLSEPEPFQAAEPAPAPRRTVKVEYRTRRWRPDAD